MHATDLPAVCENCATPLQGRYCHACGQSVVNPLRHAGHALEELFESFWHLDGRVFRTLRELVRPGRVALGYLAGQRARYIPPLRLFLVLSVLTFFVGKLVVSAPGGAPVQVQAGRSGATTDIERARTVAEVDARLKATLADIDQARRTTGAVPGLGVAMDEAERQVRAAARKRIGELGGRNGTPPPATPAPAGATPAATGTGSSTAAKPDPADGITVDSRDMGRGVQELMPRRLRDPSRPWNERDNPVDVPWLPDAGDHWVNHRVANAERNARRLNEDGSTFWPAVMSQVPTALFVLVPVFALLLKLFYIGSRRGYLEHLVVALYSHAFLLLGLLGLFVLLGVQELAGDGVVSAVAGLGKAALWIWAPIYLLLMQKRVYAQGWPATVLKYGVMGMLYVVLILCVLVFAVFAVMFGG